MPKTLALCRRACRPCSRNSTSCRCVLNAGPATGMFRILRTTAWTNTRVSPFAQRAATTLRPCAVSGKNLILTRASTGLMRACRVLLLKSLRRRWCTTFCRMCLLQIVCSASRRSRTTLHFRLRFLIATRRKNASTFRERSVARTGLIARRAVSRTCLPIQA